MKKSDPPDREDNRPGGQSRRSVPDVVAWSIIIMAASMGALLLFATLLKGHVVLVHYRFPGEDYYDYLRAARQFLLGDPYRYARYVTPPLPVMLGFPLTGVSFRVGLVTVLVLSITALVLAVTLAARCVIPEAGRRRKVAWQGALALLVSSPCLFLLCRVNIDAFVFLFLVLALATAVSLPLVAGVFLALAVGFKVYPVLLVIPLALHRRKEALISFLVSMAFLLLAAPGMWGQFLQSRVWDRVGQFKLSENGSLQVLVAVGRRMIAGDTVPSRWLEMGLVYGFWLGTLGLLTWFVFRQRDRGDLSVHGLLFLPFMVAVPALVYQYSLVLMLAWLPLLDRLGPVPWLRRPMLLGAAGMVCTQFPAVGWEVLLAHPGPNVVPALGVALMMISAVWIAASPDGVISGTNDSVGGFPPVREGGFTA